MQIGDRDGVFDGCAGAFVGRPAAKKAAFHSAAEEQDASRPGEVAVHSVVFELRHHVRLFDRVLHALFGFSFDEDVPAELAGEHDQRAIEQAPLLQVEDQLRDRTIDRSLQFPRPRVAVVVCVPAEERNVLGRDLDAAGPRLGETPGDRQPSPNGPAS